MEQHAIDNMFNDDWQKARLAFRRLVRAIRMQVMYQKWCEEYGFEDFGNTREIYTELKLTAID